MTYKCKICGGQTTVDAQNGIAICEYCGTKQALPLFSDDSERLLYESGNNYLLHSEYDKAENVFNQLLTIKPNAAELYWDLVLCKYGVTYVKDPATGKYIPTCNRTHYTPIFSDANYLKAIELSSGEKKTLFEEDAATIDNIQKGIIAVSKKEKPFDIFICYKETGANGKRSKDSIKAQNLYEKLTEAGYKVFFSRITLESKIGTEYEPYIYAALASSKIMLHITSSKEHSEAVWVKNEWSRFLGFRQNDASKTLLPLYFDMEKSDLPDEFALLSAYDMSADGFIDELLRGIKKLIPLPIMKAKRRKQLLKMAAISAAAVGGVAVLLTALFLPGYIKDQKYQEAYLNAQTLFGNAQYEEAAKEFELLGNYDDSKTMVEKCAIQPEYDAAMQLYYDGKYAEATWAFDALGDYKDSTEKKTAAEGSWRKLLASVIASSTENYVIEDTYYISKNGTVEAHSFGTLHKNISIEKNGAVISLMDGYGKLHALHENGALTTEDALMSQYTDLIKLDGFYSFDAPPFLIGLRANGTLVHGENTNYSYEINAELWAETAATWENIVDFCANGPFLIGVQADGSLCHYYNDTYADEESLGNATALIEALPQFHDVKNVTIIETYESKGEGEIYHGYILYAVTKDGKLQSFENGVFKEEGEEYCDVSRKYFLKRNGDLIDIENGLVSRYDVVQLRNNISRSGAPAYEGEDVASVQTIVYDEWIARLS